MLSSTSATIIAAYHVSHSRTGCSAGVTRAFLWEKRLATANHSCVFRTNFWFLHANAPMRAGSRSRRHWCRRQLGMISTSYHAFESGHSTPLEAGCIVCWLTVAPASKNYSAGDITICVAGPAAWRCWRRSASFGGASRLSNALRSDRAMEIAAFLARDKFTMSLSEPPQRTRHIPGHLESGLDRRYHPPARLEHCEVGRVHAASIYAASMCDRPQARHSKV